MITSHENVLGFITLRHADPWGLEVIAEIQAHAKERYPEESCGIITNDMYIPCANVAPDPKKAFQIDPAITGPLTTAGTLQAIVHSHPDGPNYPSEADQQGQIDMGIIWGVVPVIGDEIEAIAVSEVIWWGDSLPPVPLERRQFVWGVFHCYQLYRDWMMQERGIHIQNFACSPDFATEGRNIFVEEAEKAGLTNMLVGKLYGSAPNHCGVYIGDDMLLHHPSGGASGRVELLRWWPKIEVVLRYDPANSSSVRGPSQTLRQETSGSSE